MGYDWSGLLGSPAHRASKGLSVLDGKRGRFKARVMRYKVIDDYRTQFAPKTFTESLEAGLPAIAWAHDWSEPLGQYIDADDTRSHLDLIGQLDLDMIEQLAADGETFVPGGLPAVPRAHQAHAQMRSGTLNQFSVGFMPQDGREIEIDGKYYFEFTRARLDEVSLVLAGAVPGTQLLGVRSRGVVLRAPIMVISKDLAAKTILDLHQGNIDVADALQIIKQASQEQTDDGGDDEESDNPADPTGDPGDDVDDPDGDVEDPGEGDPSDATSDGETGGGTAPTDDPSGMPPEQSFDFSELADVDQILDGLTAV